MKLPRALLPLATLTARAPFFARHVFLTFAYRSKFVLNSTSPMQFFKTHAKKFKYVSLIAVGSCAFWVTVQVRKTRDILNGAFDSYIIHLVEPQSSSVQHVEPIEVDAARWVHLKSNEKFGSVFSRTWSTMKFMFARRLLNLAKADNDIMRIRAVEQLARLKNLDSWQYSFLAHLCNAHTTVGLARIEGVNPQYFLQPPMQYVCYSHDMLVHAMKDFLIFLNANSNHLCLGDFIARAFADVQDLNRIFENYYEHTDELAKLIKSTNDILPLCLESILHHSTIDPYAKDIVQQNGLYFLMEIYSRFKDIYEVNVALCNILANISIYPELLNEIHKSGWIGVLAHWLHSGDLRLSVTAGRALANLDSDDTFRSQYGRGIYSLHPISRTNEQTKVDVVFVHGLLGGVFYTWRQRCSTDSALSIIGKKTGKETIKSDALMEPTNKQEISSPIFREYMEVLNEHKQMEWEDVGNDFELIMYDTPSYANAEAKGPFVCTGNGSIDCDEDNRTHCWPKDWLAKDCQNLRIIGVNYDTSLSMWASVCPEVKTKTNLEERSNELMHKLKQAGVGTRPIIWITHSMGGLIVKNILCKASENQDQLYKNLYTNTRGVVFYSTPHTGSRIANLNQPTSLVVLPSIEVQELREESPNLKKIHEKFLSLVRDLPIKIVSFVETKSTVVTAMKFNFLMVERHSGNPGVGEYFEIPQDHLGICKPLNRDSFLYQKVLHLVKDIMAESLNYDPSNF